MKYKIDMLDEVEIFVFDYYEDSTEKRDIFKTMHKNSGNLGDLDVAEVLAAHKKVVTIWRECYKKIVKKGKLYAESNNPTNE